MTVLTRGKNSVEQAVSPETLRRMSFFTGGNLGQLRNVTLCITLQGEKYEVHVDEGGAVSVERQG